MSRRGYRHDKITLPYFEDFEGYTGSTTAVTGVEPDCWELVHADVAMQEPYKPQLWYNASYAHSGNYTLKLNSSGVYAMPALSGDIALNTLKLRMYVRQPKSYYQLQVGVWEDNNTFTLVALVNNSTTGTKYVEVDFTSYQGSGHRIAFRNVDGSGTYDYSVNYLDDIQITYNNQS